MVGIYPTLKRQAIFMTSLRDECAVIIGSSPRDGCAVIDMESLRDGGG
jgi:hypothetical protein